MKRFLLLVGSLMAINCIVLAENNHISVSKLPEKAQKYIEEHFTGKELISIKTDTEWLNNSYDVIFGDGTKIEFDKDGEWTEIRSAKTGVPDSVIPVPILQYIKNNHGQYKVVSIEKDNRRYELELDNGIEMEFDSQGNFKKYSD